MVVVTSQKWTLRCLNLIHGCFYTIPPGQPFLPGIPWLLILDINGTFLYHTHGWSFLLAPKTRVMRKTRPGLDGFTLKAVGFSIQYFRGVHEIRTLQCSINNCLYIGLFLRTEKMQRQPINPAALLHQYSSRQHYQKIPKHDRK